MKNWNSIIAGIVCGVIFESILSSPAAGFYFVPIIVVSILYAALPLTIKFLNIGIAWLVGIGCISVWALILTQWRVFSFRYFMHLAFIITLCAIIIYASTSKKQQTS